MPRAGFVKEIDAVGAATLRHPGGTTTCRATREAFLKPDNATRAPALRKEIDMSDTLKQQDWTTACGDGDPE